MKSKKRNDQLTEALGLIRQAVGILSDFTDEIHSDGILKQSTADDALDFQEVREMADDVQESLYRIIPKIRLMLYIK